MTFVYVEPDDLATFEEFEAIVQGHGGHLFPVFLQCSTSAILWRIANPDRVARKKMTSEQSARDFMARHQVCAVSRPTCLAQRPPERVGEQIEWPVHRKTISTRSEGFRRMRLDFVCNRAELA